MLTVWVWFGNIGGAGGKDGGLVGLVVGDGLGDWLCALGKHVALSRFLWPWWVRPDWATGGCGALQCASLCQAIRFRGREFGGCCAAGAQAE